MQVNNAGICFHNHTQDLFETSMEDFDKTQAVNFRGVFLGLKHASRCVTCLHAVAVEQTASCRLRTWPLCDAPRRSDLRRSHSLP